MTAGGQAAVRVNASLISVHAMLAASTLLSVGMSGLIRHWL